MRSLSVKVFFLSDFSLLFILEKVFIYFILRAILVHYYYFSRILPFSFLLLPCQQPSVKGLQGVFVF